jgi:hypothetical protein
MTKRQELLRRAAHCYLAAGWALDAGRCLEETSDFSSAGRVYEQQARWEDAARCFVRAGAWASAAECYLRSGQPLPAADCLVEAGDRLYAAWVLAHLAQRHGRAEALVDGLAPASEGEAVALDLVRARCEAARESQRASAGARLRSAVERLAALDPGPVRRRIEDWSLAVAECLGRFDLTSLIYASAVAARRPQAEEEWEKWAIARLGSVSGIPRAGDRGPTEPRGES